MVVDQRNRLSVARGAARCGGLTLVEVLLSLAISAMLLTATMAAIDVSFKAYADAASQATVNASTRMITHRLLTLVRTSTAHGPLEPDAGHSPPVRLEGQTIVSPYIELMDPKGNLIRMEYRADTRSLWLVTTPTGQTVEQSHMLLDNVASATFFLHRRENDAGLLVLDRGTMDLTVEPRPDGTLSIERGHTMPLRIIASTMPRKMEW